MPLRNHTDRGGYVPFGNGFFFRREPPTEHTCSLRDLEIVTSPFFPPFSRGFSVWADGRGSRHLSLLESTRMQLIHLSISCYYFAIHILCIRKDMNATEGFTAAIPNRSGVFFIMVFLFRFTLIIRRLVSFREKSLCGTVGFWLR